MSGVTPFVCATLALAFAASSLSTIAAFRFVHAKARGVTPYSFAAFTFAPCRSNRSTSARLSRWTAQWSSVAPASATLCA
jgi:hypothetical protein